MNLPVTRYYGSKRRVLEAIWNALEHHQIQFNTVLDVFGGTGVVSYYMSKKGKDVIYNDILSFNCEIAKALLQTTQGTFTEQDALDLLRRDPGRTYQNIVSEYFQGIYYTDEENEIIDVCVQNISSLPVSKRSSAYYILFQSCMIKRPFNIFHRKNLNLRTNFQDAKFGNKVTWEQPFRDLFIKFTKELNNVQFKDLPNIQIMNMSALNCNQHADLVYIDTPYFTRKSGTSVTYHNRYHFLEGLMHYADIPTLIDEEKINKELVIGKNKEFECRSEYINNLNRLLEIHRDSIIALSYTTEGFPSIEQLEQIVRKYKQETLVCYLGKHGFALNRNNAERQEVLIIGTNKRHDRNYNN